MPSINENEVKEDDLLQLIIFKIQDEEFGVPIDEIQEIIKLEKVTPIPDAPRFIKGIINVRGDIVTTIDMKERLFMSTRIALARHIVITRQNNNMFGLVVDQVTEVLKINKTDIKSRPTLMSKMNQEYIQGVTTSEGRLIIILNLSKILSEKEFIRLTETYQKLKSQSFQEQENENGLTFNNLPPMIERKAQPWKNPDNQDLIPESEGATYDPDLNEPFKVNFREEFLKEDNLGYNEKTPLPENDSTPPNRSNRPDNEPSIPGEPS